MSEEDSSRISPSSLLNLVARKCPDLNELFVEVHSDNLLHFGKLFNVQFASLFVLDLNISSLGINVKLFLSRFPVLHTLSLSFGCREKGMLYQFEACLLGKALPKCLESLELDDMTPRCLTMLLEHAQIVQLVLRDCSARIMEFISMFEDMKQTPRTMIVANQQYLIRDGKLLGR